MVRRSPAAVCLALLAGAFVPVGAPAARAASPGYTVQAGTFRASHLGPNSDQSCDIKYDLYMPDPVPADGSAPVILTTNGFGGSKADGASMAKYFAPRGYVVLSYSGLGFGGSDCTIELDSPEWDGRAAAQIIDFLGSLRPVLKDGPDDPRVGMWGGSYGGAIQLATASVTPKLDTIIPQITWNDLAYSLTPNNDSTSLRWTDSPPGSPKAEWTNLFFAEGLSEPLQNLSKQDHPTLVPSTLNGCPGFDSSVCLSQVTSIATGAPDTSTVAFLRHASMVDYGSRVRIPTMLMQGEGDTLFDIDEAVANRAQIMRNGAYVKLVLQSWGHSFSNDPTDDNDFADPAHPSYDDLLVQHWFDHYLKRLPVDTGPPVEYFRDWMYNANASAQPAYGSAQTWPVAPMRSLALSGTSDLVPLGTAAVTTGSSSFLSPHGPGSYSETSALQYSSGLPFSSIPATDPGLLSAGWSTPPLTSNVDVAGIPTLTFHVSTVAPSIPGVASSLPVVFAKLYDVAPDGSASLLFPRLVAPIRIANPSKPVTMTLPGVVHRFAVGHSIKLVLASTDDAYLNSTVPNAITVSTSADSPSILSLPVLGGTPATGLTPPTSTSPSSGALPKTGSLPGLANTAPAQAPSAPAALGVLALAGLALLSRRRLRRH